jgi:predicted kinase
MNPELTLLVGPPLSGKDTFLKENFLGKEIISRDDILMSLSGENDYSKAFKTVDQKLVDKILRERINSAISQEKDVVINMTNLTKKGRRKFLQQFPESYLKVAVVFPKLEMETYFERNEKRLREENKFIPTSVIKDMVERWEEVTLDEGINIIINL